MGCLLEICSELGTHSELLGTLSSLGIRSENVPDQPCAELSTAGYRCRLYISGHGLPGYRYRPPWLLGKARIFGRLQNYRKSLPEPTLIYPELIVVTNIDTDVDANFNVFEFDT